MSFYYDLKIKLLCLIHPLFRWHEKWGMALFKQYLTARIMWKVEYWNEQAKKKKVIYIWHMYENGMGCYREEVENGWAC